MADAGEIVVHHVEVGPADRTGPDPQQNLPGTGFGRRPVFEHQRAARFSEHHGSHLCRDLHQGV
jgi:hypothetical protein